MVVQHIVTIDMRTQVSSMFASNQNERDAGIVKPLNRLELYQQSMQISTTQNTSLCSRHQDLQLSLLKYGVIALDFIRLLHIPRL